MVDDDFFSFGGDSIRLRDNIFDLIIDILGRCPLLCGETVLCMVHGERLNE